MLLSGWDNRLPLAVVSLAGRHRLWGSVAAAHGLGVNSCGSRTLEHRLGSCGMLAQLLCSIWDLPGSGIEPVSPALAGRSSDSEPPGKSVLQGFTGPESCSPGFWWETAGLSVLGGGDVSGAWGSIWLCWQEHLTHGADHGVSELASAALFALQGRGRDDKKHRLSDARTACSRFSRNPES